jgi:hypothetical protein
MQIVSLKRGEKMKVAFLFTALASIQAFAYNGVAPITANFGQYTQATTIGTDLSGKKLVSIEIELNSKTGVYPMVRISKHSEKSCSFKQTLISYSGYNFQEKHYIRTYEVQIERKDLSKMCRVEIYADENQKLDDAARVGIL